jgi:hypothetical protein
VISIERIKQNIQAGAYFYSKHGDMERLNDNLSVLEVEEALLQGTVLEQYPDTGRGESCLVAGFTRNGKPVHVVCGPHGDTVAIITVYIPSPPEYKTPYERG